MNKRFLLAFVALSLSFLKSPNLYAAETNSVESDAALAQAAMAEAGDSGVPTVPASPLMADLNGLVKKINDKLQHDKNTEADLADNLKEFDALVAKHKDAKPEELARVLMMKARLYMEVLQQPDKALVVFKQIKSDYATTQVGADADQVIAMLQGMVDRKKSSEALIAGAPFPDFKESDVEGKPLSISQFKGKVLLVDFWATWCGPCVAKLPEIQKAYDKFHDQGFEIVGVSLDDDKDKLQQFTKQRKMMWPEFFDGKRWENKLALKYGVDATPTGYLIDRQGVIIAKLAGDEDLDAAITKALKK